jgi:hypothetical protein
LEIGAGNNIVCGAHRRSVGSSPRVRRFVELYNTSDAAVSLDGWSVQYRSSTGIAAPTSVAALTGSIPAKGHYLIKGGSNNGGVEGADLPAPDFVAPSLNFSGSAGTIVLAKQATAATLPTGSVIEPAGVAVQVAATGPVPPVCTAPVPPTKWYDILGWIRYGIAWIQYQQCLRG